MEEELIQCCLLSSYELLTNIFVGDNTGGQALFSIVCEMYELFVFGLLHLLRAESNNTIATGNTEVEAAASAPSVCTSALRLLLFKGNQPARAATCAIVLQSFCSKLISAYFRIIYALRVIIAQSHTYHHIR